MVTDQSRECLLCCEKYYTPRLRGQAAAPPRYAGACAAAARRPLLRAMASVQRTGDRAAASARLRRTVCASQLSGRTQGALRLKEMRERIAQTRSCTKSSTCNEMHLAISHATCILHLACSSIHARCMLQLADAHAATVTAVLRKKRPATVPTIATHGACSKVHDVLRCTTVTSARAAMSACRVGVQNNLRRHCGGTCHPYLWMLSAALISPSRAERTRTESFPATVPLQAATQPECATHAACGCVRCAVYVRSCCMLHQCQVCIGPAAAVLSTVVTVPKAVCAGWQQCAEKLHVCLHCCARASVSA